MKQPELLEVVHVLPVLLLRERQEHLPVGSVDILVVAFNPKVRCLWRERVRKNTFYTLRADITLLSCTLMADIARISCTLPADIAYIL
jgi:hypothetical protein